MAGLRRVDPWKRFVKHVTLSSDPDGCFELNLAGPYGYPTISITDESGSRGMRGNRAAWFLWHGETPAGKYVLHTCDNRKCVRPDHLYLGDAKDNIHDCMNGGRFTPPMGEKQGHAKLTRGDVIDIRRRCVLGGENQYVVAEEYGLSQSWVSRICKRESWRHVDGP